MANGFLFLPGLFLLLSLSAEACIPHSIHAEVPEVLKAGYFISKVNLIQCGADGLRVTTSDPDFTVQTDGAIATSRSITVSPAGRMFSIQIHDQTGLERKVDVTLTNKVYKAAGNVVLRRTKRRWSPPPFNIKENESPPFPKDVELIGSDSSVNHTVYYKIEGPGVTEYPFKVFSVNPETGMVRVHVPVDREEFWQFNCTARVFSQNTHQETDDPIKITINVEDENDNTPEFSGSLEFFVMEQSTVGTVVGKVNATDRDDPKTIHTKIKYRLLTGVELFLINSETGLITTRTATLDREAQYKHFVTVQIKDMDGAYNGRSATATATILLNDINDNPPNFSKKSYDGKIEENKAGVLVLRIPVDDKDLPKTDNWNAIYLLTKGNETGNFRIDTDPETNEGLLYVIKPLDFEESPNHKLEVMARNRPDLVGTTANWVSVPLDLSVTDLDEGPEFAVKNLLLHVKENVANGTVIGTYAAMDPETKSSKGIRYYKESDPASWIKVDESTGDLKIANTVDRESKFVRDDMYNITVKAVDEAQKTATGTVMIQIEDDNDNMPTPVAEKLILCEKEGELASVLVEAEDKDKKPFSAPFNFELGQGHDGNWRLKHKKDISIVLEQTKELPTGLYTVPLVIRDLQGVGKEQTVAVRVCRCLSGVCIERQSSAVLGVWGVLAMLLALAMMLLLCIFVTFACHSKKPKIHYIDDSSGGMLLKSNTEGPGDEVNSSIAIIPTTAVDGSLKGSAGNWLESSFVRKGAESSHTMGARKSVGDSVYLIPGGDVPMESQNKYGIGGFGSAIKEDRGLLEYTNRSTVDTWRTNGLFLDKKTIYFMEQDEGRYAEDLLLSYGFEGNGSPAGSVGCCSDLGGDEGLGFLDSLGPKFRTLAEICVKE